jgi:hypothetical protein
MGEEEGDCRQLTVKRREASFWGPGYYPRKRKDFTECTEDPEVTEQRGEEEPMSTHGRRARVNGALAVAHAAAKAAALRSSG